METTRSTVHASAADADDAFTAIEPITIVERARGAMERGRHVNAGASIDFPSSSMIAARGDDDELWTALAVPTTSESDVCVDAFVESETGGVSATKVRRARGERRSARLSEPHVAPVVRFGAVDVGSSGVAELDIVNDTAMAATVVVTDVEALTRDGFEVDAERVDVQPGTTERVVLTWTPKRAMSATYCGSVMCAVTFESPVPVPEAEIRVRLRGVASGEVLRALTNGAAKENQNGGATKRPRDSRLATRRSLLASPQKKVVSEDKAAMDAALRAKQRRMEEDSANLAPAPVARVLQLQRAGEDKGAKQTTEGVSDDFQAGVWLRQQELAFITWLNHTIVIDDVGTMGEDSPSANRGECASAREVRQTVRNKLTSLYSYDDELGRVLKKTFRHVDNARFRLNRGQTFLDNVALKADFTRALSCFSPFWLQLGVDVVIGGGITWKSRGDLREVQEECIAALCRDRDLEVEFGTGATPGAPPFAHGYEEALCRNILKRVLLLIFMLDRAATSGLPPNTPLLMRPHAALKQSEDVLQAALQGSMYGEGDLIRNLRQCSYRLNYKQNPIREYDFRCANLAVDLRDGVRLCRLMEVLNADILFMSFDDKNKEWKRGLLNEVHFPCASRAQKVQNVEVALRAIKDQQVGLPGTWSHIKAEDIVDGHLEHTMGLLWALMMHYAAPGLLLPKALDAEITRLGGKVPDVKRIERLSAARRGDSVIEAPQCAMEARLYAWARAACATQKVELSNLGSGFADGRALCALVRAYAPSMIPKRRISNVPLKLGNPNAEVAKNARLIAKDNFAVVCKAIQALGGVPNPTFDIRFSSEEDEGSPDPRAVSGYLLFFSARLLLLRQQEVACVRIQRWWRWNRPHRPTFSQIVRKWTAAATVIISHVRRVQGARAVEARRKAIVTVQSLRRACVVRKAYMKRRNATVKIQAFIRMCRVRQEYLDTKWATEKAQKMRKGCVQRRQFLKEKRAAGIIQGWYKMICARQTLLNKICAATIIQARWRGFTKRTEARRLGEAREQLRHNAAVKLQAAIRKCLVRKQFVRLRWAVVLTQARTRGKSARKTFVKAKKAVVKIQQNVRRFLTFNAYNQRSRMIKEEKRKAAATTIQRHWRGYITRHRIDKERYKIWFVTLMQASVRGWQTRRRVAQTRKEQAVKLRIQKMRLAKKTSVEVAIQQPRVATRRSEQLRAAMRYNAAETIQRYARGTRIRSILGRQNAAATTIQAAWRCYAARADFVIMKVAASKIQEAFRSLILDRKRRDKIERSVVILQAYVRGYLTRKRAVHKLEWHRKRITIASRVEPDDPVYNQAKKSVAMIMAPHSGKECIRGCKFFIQHWNNRTCRNALASSDALHVLMRNIHALKHSGSADASLTAAYAEHVPLLNAAYELFQLVAGEKRYSHAVRKYPEILFLEHVRLFQDDPKMLASAIGVMDALFDNVGSKISVASENDSRLDRAEEILAANRATLRTTVSFYAKSGLTQNETKAREALVLIDRCLSSLNRLRRHARAKLNIAA